MRYIRTSNNLVELIEAKETGEIISVKGFQFGELYFSIANMKVTFYLRDQENPFRNDIWTCNIPMVMDDIVYETEKDAAKALHAIMNDRFQEQIDELDEKIDEEICRAKAEETRIETKLDNEIARSTAEDTRLDAKITKEIDDRIADVDAEQSRALAEEQRLEQKIDNEIARAIAKENEILNKVNLNTAAIENEVQRATTAEGILSGMIDTLDTKVDGVDDKIDAEVIRSTAKDAEHDSLISGLTSDIASETTARIAGDNALTTALSNEVNRALGAEEDLDDKIDAEIARANSEETRIEGLLNAEITRSTAKDAEHDTKLSGMSDSIRTIDEKINSEILRATTAESGIQNQVTNNRQDITTLQANDRTQDLAINTIQATMATKSDLNNYYTKAESDAKYATEDYVDGKFSNSYTKPETDALLATKADKANAVASAEYNSSNKVINFKNADSVVISTIDARDFIRDGMVDNVVVSNGNLVITFNTDSGKEPISIPLTNIFNPNNYYTKSEVDASQLAQDNKINALSGKVDTIETEIDDIDLSNYYTKTEVDTSQLVQDNKINTLNGNVSALSGKVDTIEDEIDSINLDNYYTKTEVDTKVNGKQDTLVSGTNIKTINGASLLGSGNIIIEGGGGTVDAYTKAESDAKYATITNFNSHSGDSTVHVTAAEKSAWNNKSNFSGSYNDLTDKPTLFSGNYNDLTNKPTIPNYTAGTGITISNNVISAKIWYGTQTQFDAITTKSADTIYLIYNN